MAASTATAPKSTGNTAVADQEPAFEPVPYYNPIVTDERFLILDGPGHMRRFHAGRFVPQSAAEETSVRAALRRYGPGKADRWRGDDMNKEWVSKKGDFRTRNEDAREDYETHRDK